MSPKNFIFNVAVFTLITLGLYISMFYYQLNAPVKAAWWVHDIYQYKDFKASSIKSKKIIIISGSNGLFGTNSKLIESETGYPVINLASQGALDIDFLYYKISQSIKEGDIVIMPLEFAHYSRVKPTSWFTNNMMAWGEDYLTQLSLIQTIQFIIDTAPNRVLEGVLSQIQNNSTNTKKTPREVVLKWFETSPENPNWKGVKHGYRNMNKHGDYNVDSFVTFNKDNPYIGRDLNLSQHFIETYFKINNLVKQHNGKLFLTYPVTIRNSLFDLSEQESQNRVENLELLLHQHRIDIYCNAALFNLDRKYFFNTKYHPNKYGALIRSSNLGDCIDGLINNRYQKMSYDDAIKKTNYLQFRYQDEVKIASVSHH
ncbi:hypothetical protein [Cycloclasticus pugetii]|uniref:hypothetical protein n=1 Tax=Cycloclasticus pugetii TaxID=34068 RepID=UPI0009119978|nr:hypothetical protein [Cycloclasticus pugetii]SHI95314.1 hypothetical protein SAMN05519226_1180 [Cycloclasticus pugetii]